MQARKSVLTDQPGQDKYLKQQLVSSWQLDQQLKAELSDWQKNADKAVPGAAKSAQSDSERSSCQWDASDSELDPQ